MPLYPFGDSTCLPLEKEGWDQHPLPRPKLALLQPQDSPGPSPSPPLPHQVTLTHFPHLEFPHCGGRNRGSGRGTPHQAHSSVLGCDSAGVSRGHIISAYLLAHW